MAADPPHTAPTDLTERAEQASHGPADRLIERIAERVGGAASVSAVYGTPVERGGVTVIPVAKVRWGFGGGMGRGSARGGDQVQDEGSGEGGGGGVIASPVGYIEIRDDATSFHRIRERSVLLSPAVIIALAVAIMLLRRGLTKARRA